MSKNLIAATNPLIVGGGVLGGAVGGASGSVVGGYVGVLTGNKEAGQLTGAFVGGIAGGLAGGFFGTSNVPAGGFGAVLGGCARAGAGAIVGAVGANMVYEATPMMYHRASSKPTFQS